MDEEDFISRLSIDSVGSSKSVQYKALGDNQMTFVINDEEVGDYEMESQEEEEELLDDEMEERLTVDQAGSSGELTAEDETKQRERELTDKYLSGQLSFKDFVQEINNDDETYQKLQNLKEEVEKIRNISLLSFDHFDEAIAYQKARYNL